ncbi:MAG: hypothetical protein A3G33_09470 [Omnitrophica bacterium RIFCSPLOWO2_12_FULL_44_17]|uniref:ADP,ATP carrier protein n=1 Tax=Candidatus Danuiimicrobium aquiferis TaxID=1801832 RepID=A0A1G1KWW3_9BACT|nr:MAG: hypothetical protein A3B72_09890 [Omnitrophica bacterium RIFCSPHIGHO2_02_FULL_45_28]OGW91044.1 MAG: hypothetical protein A3E74_00335 [Omnitrophica bacterium RIFCSPHIGHO2_12_FULL_44_12]OGW97410.1 MAG: hypothetical protein A3G33_09470 [Omnitrophica bacterium RIFCSPLOWO2_12_FULL_44_17]OGX04484.1 MAG: hypothetical protein A3J12_10510 [Omnitrophica bacterium RIFCSPLOWO2_02_FULL_44_11]
MIDWITRVIQPIVPIKREEWTKSILMFFYFFFTITTLYILKPIRNSIFLEEHGASSLRYAYMGEVVFLSVIAFFYAKIANCFKRKNILVSITISFFLVNSLIFWVIFKLGWAKWVAFFFYIWVASYSITVVTQFWTVANDLFNVDEAKRLFGFISSGGGLGGMFGGWITDKTALVLGSENLLFIVAGCLLISIVFVNSIWKKEEPAFNHQLDQERLTAQRQPDQGSHVKDYTKKAWKVIFDTRYILLITALVVITKVASTLIDNQFNAVVELNIAGKDLKTKFFGNFFYYLNFITFILQLLIASRVLRYFGIGIPLVMLPVGLLFGAGLTSFIPILFFAQFTKIFDGSMNYSISHLSKEILYLPIPLNVRYRVKPIIDMLAYRASKMIAGLLIIIVSFIFPITDEKLGYVVLFLVPVWLAIIWATRREYLLTIKKLISKVRKQKKVSSAVQNRAIEALTTLEGERSYKNLRKLLVHRSSAAEKISSTACLALYSGASNIDRVRQLAHEMIRYEALELKEINMEELDQMLCRTDFEKPTVLDDCLAKLLEQDERYQGDLKVLFQEHESRLLLQIINFLRNPKEEIANKHKAVLILTLLRTQGAVDVLLENLKFSEDHSYRFILIQGLNRIWAKEKGVLISPTIVKKEMIKEIHEYKAIDSVYWEYKDRKNVIRTEEDYLMATLHVIREEAVERISRLLALLYESDLIRLIYDRFSDGDAEKHIRANALELLRHVAEPGILRMLKPVIDPKHKKISDKTLEEILKRFVGGRDNWLVICGLFLILELHLKHLYPSIQEKTASESPLIRETAEIILAKSAGDDKNLR